MRCEKFGCKRTWSLLGFGLAMFGGLAFFALVAKLVNMWSYGFCAILVILLATRTWRNCFVALSVPSTRLRSLQNHPQNLLLNLWTWPAKHTDGASSGRLHSDDQVRPQNHQMRKLAVCLKNSCSLFLVPPSISPWFSFYVSLSASRHNRILLCFSGMCQNPVMLFLRQCTFRISRVWVSVRVRASLRMAALVCTFSGTECTFIWTAPLSDDDTWRHATHI